MAVMADRTGFYLFKRDRTHDSQVSGRLITAAASYVDLQQCVRTCLLLGGMLTIGPGVQ